MGSARGRGGAQEQRGGGRRGRRWGRRGGAEGAAATARRRSRRRTPISGHQYSGQCPQQCSGQRPQRCSGQCPQQCSGQCPQQCMYSGDATPCSRRRRRPANRRPRRLRGGGGGGRCQLGGELQLGGRGARHSMTVMLPRQARGNLAEALLESLGQAARALRARCSGRARCRRAPHRAAPPPPSLEDRSPQLPLRASPTAGRNT